MRFLRLLLQIQLHSVKWCEVAVEQDLTLGIETNLWLRDGNNAWEICVWSSEAGQGRVNKWLEANGITPDESRRGRKGKDGWVYASYEYTESPEVVGNKCKKLIQDICNKKPVVPKNKSR